MTAVLKRVSKPADRLYILKTIHTKMLPKKTAFP